MTAVTHTPLFFVEHCKRCDARTDHVADSRGWRRCKVCGLPSEQPKGAQPEKRVEVLGQKSEPSEAFVDEGAAKAMREGTYNPRTAATGAQGLAVPCPSCTNLHTQVADLRAGMESADQVIEAYHAIGLRQLARIKELEARLAKIRDAADGRGE